MCELILTSWYQIACNVSLFTYFITLLAKDSSTGLFFSFLAAYHLLQPDTHRAYFNAWPMEQQWRGFWVLRDPGFEAFGCCATLNIECLGPPYTLTLISQAVYFEIAEYQAQIDAHEANIA
jgi:hypothetical protein